MSKNPSGKAKAKAKGQMIGNRAGAHINFDAPAALRKWPALQSERRGTAPHLIMDGTLDEQLRMYMRKLASTRHLYEIHTSAQPPLIGAIVSGDAVVELAR
jgi:hypothetical protein